MSHHCTFPAASNTSSTSATDSKEEDDSTKKSKPQHEQQQSDTAISRYAQDMAQAKLMRGGGTASSSSSSRRLSPSNTASTELTEDDYKLGLQGLERAQAYRRQGDLEAALKLYELSLELLIRYLKNRHDDGGGGGGPQRSAVETRIHAALSEAERIKTSLKKQTAATTSATNKQHQLPTSSLQQSLSNALASVMNTTTSNTSSTSGKKQNATPLHPRKSQTTIRTRPVPPKTSPTSRTSATRPTPSAIDTANTELRNTVLNEFYVPPSDLQQTTWNDVAGLETVKRSLQETAILPLLRPDLFTGLRRPQNVLLYGPPGTGKTLLVKAVAHESGSHLFVVTSSAVTSKFLGEAEKLVRTLFQVARELAPCIIFMDEIDALLATRRSDSSEHEATRRLKTEFMVQMDGIRSGSGGSSSSDATTASPHVLLIACTNCPWDVDPAVLRRFPRRIYVPLPDDAARRGLIQYLLKKTGRHSLTSRHISTLVKRTRGFSGSDITAMASEASFGPLRALGGMDAIRDCRPEDVRPVQLSDFQAVLDQATNSVTESMLQRYEDWKQQQAASS